MNRYKIHERRKKIEFLQGPFFKDQNLRLVKKITGPGLDGFPLEIKLVSFEPRNYPPGDDFLPASQYPRFKVKDLSKKWFNKKYIHASYLLNYGYYEPL